MHLCQWQHTGLASAVTHMGRISVLTYYYYYYITYGSLSVEGACLIIATDMTSQQTLAEHLSYIVEQALVIPLLSFFSFEQLHHNVLELQSYYLNHSIFTNVEQGHNICGDQWRSLGPVLQFTLKPINTCLFPAGPNL